MFECISYWDVSYSDIAEQGHLGTRVCSYMYETSRATSTMVSYLWFFWGNIPIASFFNSLNNHHWMFFTDWPILAMPVFWDNLLQPSFPYHRWCLVLSEWTKRWFVDLYHTVKCKELLSELKIMVWYFVITRRGGTHLMKLNSWCVLF